MHPIANFKLGLNTQNAIHCALHNPMIRRIFENNGLRSWCSLVQLVTGWHPSVFLY